MGIAFLLILIIIIILPSKHFIKTFSRLNTSLLNSRKTPRRELLVEMSRIKEWLYHSNNESLEKLPRYKFFTSLIFDLVKMNRDFGADIENSLQSLRSGLIKDDQFERKLKKLQSECAMQIVAISFVTWVFILISSSMLNMQPSTFFLSLIFFLQAFGAFIFIKLYSSRKEKRFKVFSFYLEAILKFQNLLQVGLPLTTILYKSKVDKIINDTDKRLRGVNQQFSLALEKLQTQGVDISEELNFSVNEIWFLQELEFEQFSGFITGLKLIILPVFYLSGYFLYLLNLINTGMGI